MSDDEELYNATPLPRTIQFPSYTSADRNGRQNPNIHSSSTDTATRTPTSSRKRQNPAMGSSPSTLQSGSKRPREAIDYEAAAVAVEDARDRSDPDFEAEFSGKRKARGTPRKRKRVTDTTSAPAPAPTATMTTTEPATTLTMTPTKRVKTTTAAIQSTTEATRVQSTTPPPQPSSSKAGTVQSRSRNIPYDRCGDLTRASRNKRIAYIRENWGLSPDQWIPATLMQPAGKSGTGKKPQIDSPTDPKDWSSRLLEALEQLSNHTPNQPDVAFQALEDALARQDRRAAGSSLLATDVAHAVQSVRSGQRNSQALDRAPTTWNDELARSISPHQHADDTTFADGQDDDPGYFIISSRSPSLGFEMPVKTDPGSDLLASAFTSAARDSAASATIDVITPAITHDVIDAAAAHAVADVATDIVASVAADVAPDVATTATTSTAVGTAVNAAASSSRAQERLDAELERLETMQLKRKEKEAIVDAIQAEIALSEQKKLVRELTRLYEHNR